MDPTLIWPPSSLGGSGAAFLAGDMFATMRRLERRHRHSSRRPESLQLLQSRQVANLSTSVFAYPVCRLDQRQPAGAVSDWQYCRNPDGRRHRRYGKLITI